MVRLAQQRAGVVQSADVVAAHLPGMVDAARQLTALTSLALQATPDFGYEQPDAKSCGAALARQPLGLGALVRLRDLLLCVDDLQPATCGQLSALSGLTHLDVGTVMAQVPPQLWQAAGCMPRLAHLRLVVHVGVHEATCTIDGEAWVCLAACTQLTALTLRHCLTHDWERASGKRCAALDHHTTLPTTPRPTGQPPSLPLSLTTLFRALPQTLSCFRASLGSSRCAALS